MSVQQIKILKKDFETHNITRFITEKPEGYTFIPGQATELSININGWEDKKRPFTFTSLPEDKILEFFIKGYETDGVTKKIQSLSPGDKLNIGESWGSIQFKGPGLFLAGGTGVTPFISIFRNLKRHEMVQGNILLFSNKTQDDVFLEKELRFILGNNAIFTLSEQDKIGYENGRINNTMISKYLKGNKFFYICGPMQFIVDMKIQLDNLGVRPENVIIEI